MNPDNQPPGTQNLAPVYLDNKPIALKDAKPKVSAILSAMGKPETTDVKWLQFQPNTQGKPLRGEEVLDRTKDPSKPIYLTSSAKGGIAGAGSGAKGEQAAGGFSPTVGAAFGASGESRKGASGAGASKGDRPAAREGQDDEGMQDDAEVGGESGRTATTDE